MIFAISTRLAPTSRPLALEAIPAFQTAWHDVNYKGRRLGSIADQIRQRWPVGLYIGSPKRPVGLRLTFSLTLTLSSLNSIACFSFVVDRCVRDRLFHLFKSPCIKTLGPISMISQFWWMDCIQGQLFPGNLSACILSLRTLSKKILLHCRFGSLFGLLLNSPKGRNVNNRCNKSGRDGLIEIL